MFFMKIVFFGNTKYSIIGAKILHKAFPVTLFVTIPNSPIAILAKQLTVPYLETETLGQPTIDQIQKLNPDFLVVEDYGLILPRQLLEIPKYAPLNIHHSLLPKYRGPSPAPSAILAGDKVSGVTIIRMNEEIDSGDILAQQEYELSADETTDSLLTKLNQLGGTLVISVIKQYLEGETKPIPQNYSQATFTKRFTKQDGYFDIQNPPSPEELDRMIRAYYPWPGVWTKWNPSTSSGQVKIVKFYPEGKIQMEGKKVLSFKDFQNGYPDFPLKNL